MIIPIPLHLFDSLREAEAAGILDGLYKEKHHNLHTTVDNAGEMVDRLMEDRWIELRTHIWWYWRLAQEENV